MRSNNPVIDRVRKGKGRFFNFLTLSIIAKQSINDVSCNITEPVDCNNMIALSASFSQCLQFVTKALYRHREIDKINISQKIIKNTKLPVGGSPTKIVLTSEEEYHYTFEVTNFIRIYCYYLPS